jgi:hypothetical protein
MRDEVERLLTSIERILLIGPYEWDEVVSQHEMYFPDLDRSKDALKRKFSSLYSTRIPTGDPTIPPDVLRAKRAYEEIKRKAEISEGEDNNDNNDADVQHGQDNNDADVLHRQDGDGQYVDSEDDLNDQQRQGTCFCYCNTPLLLHSF